LRERAGSGLSGRRQPGRWWAAGAGAGAAGSSFLPALGTASRRSASSWPGTALGRSQRGAALLQLSAANPRRSAAQGPPGPASRAQRNPSAAPAVQCSAARLPGGCLRQQRELACAPAKTALRTCAVLCSWRHEMQRAASKLPCAATTASLGRPAWCSRLSMFCV
jgi:hypothetical protein